MFSLMEQLALANGRPGTPAKGRQGYGTRHNMVGAEIDAIVVKIVEREPGLLASEIFDRVTHPGLTQTSVIESLRRLYDAKKVHQVQRLKQDKARYWPRAMIREAEAYRRSVVAGSTEDMILQVLADGEERSTPMIAEAIGKWDTAVMDACKRLVARGLVESTGRRRGRGNGLASWWRVKA